MVVRSTAGDQTRVLLEAEDEGRDVAAAWYIEGNPTYTAGSEDLAGE